MICKRRCAAGGKDTTVAARGRGTSATFEFRRGLEPEDKVGVATAWRMPGMLDNVSAADCEAVWAMVRSDPTYRADPQAANWIGKAIAVVLGSTSTARPTGSRPSGWAKLHKDRAPATRPNDVWVTDFVHDQLATGKKICVLTVADTSRHRPAIQLPGEHVVAKLERALDLNRAT